MNFLRISVIAIGCCLLMAAVCTICTLVYEKGYDKGFEIGFHQGLLTASHDEDCDTLLNYPVTTYPDTAMSVKKFKYGHKDTSFHEGYEGLNDNDGSNIFLGGYTRQIVDSSFEDSAAQKRWIDSLNAMENKWIILHHWHSRY